MTKIKPEELDLKDQVVNINRVTKVVKGGKNFRFTALVVVGDGRGHVGYGAGKAGRLLSRPVAWRVLDVLIGLTMLAIAASLAVT